MQFYAANLAIAILNNLCLIPGRKNSKKVIVSELMMYFALNHNKLFNFLCKKYGLF